MKLISDHLTVERYLHTDTGVLEFIYYYKKKCLPNHFLQGRFPTKYIAYELIGLDLDDAHDWITEFYNLLPNRNTEDVIPNKMKYIGGNPGSKKTAMFIKTLFYSSVIFYGKCFSQAEGRGGVKLERNNLPANWREKHDEIILYRNTIAAHSGIGEWDTGQLRYLIPPKKDKKIAPGFVPEIKRVNFVDDRQDDFSFLGLINIAQAHANAKKSEMLKKICTGNFLSQVEDLAYTLSHEKKRPRKKK